MNIAISTLGCKVNQCDSAEIIEQLLQQGFRLVPFSSSADVYLINTCTVTEKTDAQSRQLIRRALRSNPEGCVIVTGCYAQRSPASVSSLSERIHVFGNLEKPDIVTELKSILQKQRPVTRVSGFPVRGTVKSVPVKNFLHQTRAFLKIQDGCNARCAYCIVPKVRGPSRSLPFEDVKKNLHLLARSGYREIVLTGIHLGGYGRDLNPPFSLLDVLKSVETDHTLAGIRIRLSSIEPTEISDELIIFLSYTQRVCPHLHIPLQSGDKSILKKMNRPYTPSFFKALVEKLVASVANIQIGIDIIAGFPQETDTQFQNTISLVSKLPVGYLHVFPYSSRPGTKAVHFEHHVPEMVKKQRAKALRHLGQKKREKFYFSFLNKALTVLVEGRRDRKTQLLRGFSENYIPVLLSGGDFLMGKMVKARVRKVRGLLVYAEADN